MTNAEYNYENSPIQFSSQKTHHADANSLPLVLRIPDLMQILGIGRNTAYSLVRSGQIRVLRVGRQIRIPRSEIVRFLSSAL